MAHILTQACQVHCASIDDSMTTAVADSLAAYKSERVNNKSFAMAIQKQNTRPSSLSSMLDVLILPQNCCCDNVSSIFSVSFPSWPAAKATSSKDGWCPSPTVPLTNPTTRSARNCSQVWPPFLRIMMGTRVFFHVSGVNEPQRQTEAEAIFLPVSSLDLTWRD